MREFQKKMGEHFAASLVKYTFNYHSHTVFVLDLVNGSFKRSVCYAGGVVIFAACHFFQCFGELFCGQHKLLFVSTRKGDERNVAEWREDQKLSELQLFFQTYLQDMFHNLRAQYYV